MNNAEMYDPVCLVYPGTYTPILNEEEVKFALKKTADGDTLLPPVNVKELADLYKIEVAVPGVKREDFLITVKGNVLSVCVVREETVLSKGEIFQMHEFNYDIFDRHIVLPNNTDPEFTSAEYIAGMLRLYVPKTKTPSTNLQTKIVVY
jgi:HSP20 family protein